MAVLTNWLAFNTASLINVSVVVCGVVILYLVMARTIKHRQNTVTQEQ